MTRIRLRWWKDRLLNQWPPRKLSRRQRRRWRGMRPIEPGGSDGEPRLGSSRLCFRLRGNSGDDHGDGGAVALRLVCNRVRARGRDLRWSREALSLVGAWDDRVPHRSCPCRRDLRPYHYPTEGARTEWQLLRYGNDYLQRQCD